jgi:excisionase family DNA binding protein
VAHTKAKKSTIRNMKPLMQAPVRPIVYDIPSAAQALLLSVSTVRKLIRRGLLPVSRIGDRVLIQEKSMRKLMDEAESGEGITTQSLNAEDWLREGEL